MSGRTLFGPACALAIGLGVLNAPAAQSDPKPLPQASADTDDDWKKDVTVLTIAPDGSWGVATEPSLHRALANAISACKSKYKSEIGCGHQMTSVREGWSLAIRCGDENIIASATTLAAAEQSAINREVELRRSYVPDMPPCIRVLAVDPRGVVVAPNGTDSVGMVMPRRSGSR
jgi:hypothetical protein